MTNRFNPPAAWLLTAAEIAFGWSLIAATNYQSAGWFIIGAAFGAFISRAVTPARLWLMDQNEKPD